MHTAMAGPFCASPLVKHSVPWMPLSSAFVYMYIFTQTNNLSEKLYNTPSDSRNWLHTGCGSVGSAESKQLSKNRKTPRDYQSYFVKRERERP